MLPRSAALVYGLVVAMVGFRFLSSQLPHSSGSKFTIFVTYIAVECC